MTIKDFVCLVMSVTRNILRKLALTKSASAQPVPKTIQGFVILDLYLETANYEMISDIYIIHLLGMPRVH